jgi:alkylation response protein AidB-like acyl-CoA dehydrogenase
MSHHLDSPEARQDPRLNISDCYVFPGTRGVVMILDSNPLSSPGGFHPEGRYEFKIDTNGDAVEDLAFRLTFGPQEPDGRQSLELSRLDGVMARDRDAEGEVLVRGHTEEVLDARGSVRVWAGAAGEPFYVDLRLATAVAQALADGSVLKLGDWEPAKAANSFAGTNVRAIVLEVPNSAFGSRNIGVFTTTSLPTDAGVWRQVNRCATPMITMFFEPLAESQLANDYNHCEPSQTPALFGDRVAKMTAGVVRAMGSSSDPEAYGRWVAEQLLPDILWYEIGTAATFGFARRNGRGLTECAVDVMFSMVFNRALPLGLDHRSVTGKLRPSFPYLPLPEPISQPEAVPDGEPEPVEQMLEFLRGYADERLDSRLIDERRTLPPSLVLDLGAEGFFGLQVERKYGGRELSFTDMFRVMEQAGAIDPNVALFIGVHNTLGIPPIRYFADAQTQDQILPLVASGRALATVASTEPGIGSHLRGMSTTATRQPDGGYVLNGRKRLISLGAWAGYLTVLARLDDGRGNDLGITAFLVPGNNPGLTPGPEALTLGMRAVPQNDIDIDNLRLPGSSLLGEEGQGRAVAQTSFTAGRWTIAATCVGAMKRCQQIASRFVSRRTVATGNLVDNGLARQILSRNVAATRALETLVAGVAQRLDLGQTVPAEFYSACKIIGGELAWMVIDSCVQLMGGRGFLDTAIVGQFLRDYRLMRLFEGPTEALSVYLGTSILEHPETFQAMLTNQFPASPTVELFTSACAELAGSDSTASKRHVLADALGRLACWTITTSMVNAVPQRDRTEIDGYTAHWCEQQVLLELSAARSAVRPVREPLLATTLTEHIAGYDSTIGNTEQTFVGEARELDILLRKQAEPQSQYSSSVL